MLLVVSERHGQTVAGAVLQPFCVALVLATGREQEQPTAFRLNRYVRAIVGVEHEQAASVEIDQVVVEEYHSSVVACFAFALLFSFAFTNHA